MAAAWLDERDDATLYLARGSLRPLWLGTADGLYFASTGARSRSSRRRCRRRLDVREVREGRLLTSSAGGSCASGGSGPTAATARTATCRPCARRARPSRASSASRRSPQSAPPSVPSGRHLDALLAQALADEVLERGPRAARDVEQPVDLPLGQERGVGAARLRPVGHLRQAAERRRRAPRPARSRARDAPRPAAPRTRPRAARCRASRTCARRATPTGRATGARRRDRARSASDRAPRRAPELLEELVARQEPAREEPGRALGRVPRAEVLDDGLRVDARPGILRELAHRRRPTEPLGGRAELLEDLLVRVAAAQAGAEGRELGLVDAHRARAW